MGLNSETNVEYIRHDTDESVVSRFMYTTRFRMPLGKTLAACANCVLAKREINPCTTFSLIVDEVMGPKILEATISSQTGRDLRDVESERNCRERVPLDPPGISALRTISSLMDYPLTTQS